MATVAAAAPLPSNAGQNVPSTTNNPASSAKRKRVDPRIGPDGQRSLRDDHSFPSPKPNQTRGKRQQSGTFEPPGNRGRQPSLRHVKDSTEVLRQKSTKRANPDNPSESTPEGRSGRQFTVANVGDNGKIYLR